MSIASLVCPRCDLVQSPPASGLCRRCRTRIVEECVPEPELEPAFDPGERGPAFASVAGSANDLEPAFDPDLRLELDLPVRPSVAPGRPLAPLGLPPTPSPASLSHSATSIRTSRSPVARSVPDEPEKGAARFFLDPATGVIRSWVVVTMLVVCLGSMLVGRLAKMREERLSQATRAMDE